MHDFQSPIQIRKEISSATYEEAMFPAEKKCLSWLKRRTMQDQSSFYFKWLKEMLFEHRKFFADNALENQVKLYHLSYCLNEVKSTFLSQLCRVKCRLKHDTNLQVKRGVPRDDILVYCIVIMLSPTSSHLAGDDHFQF